MFRPLILFLKMFTSLCRAHGISVSHDGTISKPKEYWSLLDCAREAENKIFTAPDADIIDTLEDLLLNVIEREMIADVPLGAFLSGGIDSSLIVSPDAAMRPIAPSRHSPLALTTKHTMKQKTQKTGSATHRNRTHRTITFHPKMRLILSHLSQKIWDQPFSDASQIPTLLVSRMTREHVTVALSGDGGDELFAGYNRHFRGCSLWKKT